MTFVRLSHLGKTFGTVTALDDVSLDIDKGTRTAIVGPSGSGKTTLLRLIAGFERPDTGSIAMDDRTLADETRFVPPHKRAIGYVPQEGALFPHLSVAQNIGFGIPRSVPGRAQQVRDLMDLVGLEPNMETRPPDALSGGQQQRVALARALARKPQIMLLDEPFSSLDAGLRVATRKAVAELLRASNITAVLVTHDQEEALSFADHVAVVRRGRLVQAGTPQALFLRPVDLETARFLGETIVLAGTMSGRDRKSVV